ncbi:MAG: pseudouridine synthase [Pseudomonadota bacterium]
MVSGTKPKQSTKSNSRVKPKKFSKLRSGKAINLNPAKQTTVIKTKTKFKKTTQEKIQKILAHAGVASRRQIEEYLQQGRIKVNGKTAKLGDRATVNDKFSLNNRPVRLREFTAKMLIYNKPEGIICTRSDPKRRRNVFQDLPRLSSGRWVMIGRLDINTQGLLIFTNDGKIANQYMHPRYEIEREYAVRILGKVDNNMLDKLKKGVKLKEGLMRFDKIVAKPATDAANRWFQVIIKEGKFREVRRLWESQGVKVSRLIRVRFGDIELPRDLPRGRWREIEIPQSFA